MPSFEQLELFSLQLPNLTMKELLGLFSDLARLDGSYFLRDMEPMKVTIMITWYHDTHMHTHMHHFRPLLKF
jgi:hypothetical protein